MDCEEKEIDATEEICGKLKVSNTDEQICRLDSTNIGCKLINYCQYVKGTSDDECSKYPVKDTTKECKTNSEKNKCEEVSKPSTGSGSLIKTSIYLLLIFSILI